MIKELVRKQSVEKLGNVYFGDGDVEEILWFNYFADRKIGFTRIDFITVSGTYIYMEMIETIGRWKKSVGTYYRLNEVTDHGMPIYNEIDIDHIDIYETEKGWGDVRPNNSVFDTTEAWC